MKSSLLLAAGAFAGVMGMQPAAAAVNGTSRGSLESASASRAIRLARKTKPAPAAPVPPPPSAAPAPAPAEPAPPAEPENSSAPVEALPADPDLPARLPQRFYCPVPAETAPKADLKLRCAIKASSSLKAVVLNYRAPGSEEFTRVVMTKGKKGWYEGVVPASAIVGSALQIYMEADGWGDKVLHTVGTPVSPTVILVQGSGPAPGETGPEKDPLQIAADARGRDERRREMGLHTREPKSMFLSVGGGFGGGWMPTRTLEFRTDGKAAGTAHEGLLHVIPELGYQIDDNWAFGVQLRYQMIPNNGGGDTRPGAPPTNAWLALAHVYRFYGESNFQGFLSATAGGGSGFRLYVAPHPDANNEDSNFPRSDTVVGGPVVLGPGAGFIYHFNDFLALVVEARALAGVPKFAVLGEGTASLQWAFWTKGKAGAAPEPTPEIDPTLSE